MSPPAILDPLVGIRVELFDARPSGLRGIGMSQVFTAYVEFDADTKLYVGSIPGLPGAHSQGATLDELNRNLREVLELIIEEKKSRGESIDMDPFVGIQQIPVDV